MYDIIIVGAGPAGLTAALYALRANKKVLVLEAKSYGGQIINASKIENYPGISMISGVSYAEELYQQVKKLGVEYKTETVLKVLEDKSVVTNKNTYQAKAVILAVGREKRKLKVENEDKFVGKGVSYCATCDGNFYKNKKVAVVGGGNTALEDALYLSTICSSVTLIHRRETFKADASTLKMLQERENVHFILNAQIAKLSGEEKLESIELITEDKTPKVLKVDGLFIAVGQEPQNEIFENVVDLDENGYILAKDDVHTKTPGIYVAGDARIKLLRQLTTAVSDGSIAATEAILQMRSQEKKALKK